MIINQFKTALMSSGIHSPEIILNDGQLHRFWIKGDRTGTRNGWYILHSDPPVLGLFGCWKRSIVETWRYSCDKNLNRHETNTFNLRYRRMHGDYVGELERIHAACRDEATQQLNSSFPATNRHSYLVRKAVESFGLRYYRGALLLTVCDINGVIHGLQKIFPNGEKRYLPGTNKTAHFFKLSGETKQHGSLLIAEGYATAASLHMATGLEVIVAFDAGNLEHVALALRSKFPKRRIVICADSDTTGIAAAQKAAIAVNANILSPRFMQPDSGKDWNDLHLVEGLNAVQQQLEEMGINDV